MTIKATRSLPSRNRRKVKGLLYVGTDDGRVHVSKNGGKDWTDLSDNIPEIPNERWITRLECDYHDEDTVYLTIDRHRNDDRKPYCFQKHGPGKDMAKPGGQPQGMRANPRHPCRRCAIPAALPWRGVWVVGVARRRQELAQANWIAQRAGA